MAHRAPIARGRADFDTDAKGFWSSGSLGLPPEGGLTPGGFKGVVKVVEYWMGGSVLVDQAVGTYYGAARSARESMGAGSHGKGHNFLAEDHYSVPCDRFKLSRGRQESVIFAHLAGAPAGSRFLERSMDRSAKACRRGRVSVPVSPLSPGRKADAKIARTLEESS
jgi:hypothetical protein